MNLSQNNPLMKSSISFDFQNLEVYKKANDFYLECKTLVITSSIEDVIKDQLGRASLSIPLNIAEGAAKFSAAHRKNFFVTARGSVYECVAILDVLRNTKTITEKVYESLVSKAAEISKILFVMIKNLNT